MLAGGTVGVTSGVFQSWPVIEGICSNPWCDFVGEVEACEDREDATCTWVCPLCEKEHVEEPPC